MSWKEFLEALQSPTVLVLAGVALSYLLDIVPKLKTWYNESLSPVSKRVVFFLFCLVIAWGAATLYWLSGYFEVTSLRVAWEDLYWPALVSAGSGFASGTVVATRKLSSTPTYITKRLDAAVHPAK